ncbi:MAG: DUF4395 family protein [Candidatus Reddybacter sp.]
MRSNNNDLSFQQRSLFQQGYPHYPSDELRQMRWGLRFTPTACTSMTLIALIYQLPWLAYVVSCLGLIAFLLPSAQPMDLLYNHIVRKPFKAIALPADPLQRRLACLSAGVLNFFVATFFLLGWTNIALAIGAMLVVLQVIVITTHFCFSSWIYELFMRALNKWQLPLSPEEANEHVKQGAVLVDVRSPVEFSKNHLPNAINIPVDDIDTQSEQLRGKTILLYCASGMRSQIALGKLQRLEFPQVYDAGEMKQLGALASA